ncbi:MAG: PQQ-binding-like beta-propeller repeat protein [Byssovorax sp.]
MDSPGRITVGSTVRGLRGTYRVDAVHGDGSFGIAFAATVTESDEKAANAVVLVQQRVEGEPLSAWIDRRERFPRDKLVPLLRELLDILRYLHERTPSVVHRDIHPGNVIVDRDGRPFLVDFGAIQDGLRLAGRSSTFVGTAGYMPPEQILGAAIPASDLYALGMTLITAAAGVPPAEMPIDVGRSKVRVRELLRDAPANLVATLDRMVEPLANDRIATAKQARALLDGASARRRRGWIVAPIAVVAVVAAGAAYLFAFHVWREGSRPTHPAFEYTPPLPDYFGRAFLLDANGDGTADVMGMDYTGDYFAVDGKSGARLWTAHAAADWFTAQGGLILGWKEKTFGVQAFSARDGAPIWKAQLSDTFGGATFGDGCVVLRSADHHEVSLDARNGTPLQGACSAPSASPSAPYDPGVVVIVDGDQELVLADEGPGTPRTSLSLRKASKVIWTKTLDATEGAPHGGGNVRRVGSALLIVGKRRSDPAGGFVLFRLDAETGEVLKSVDVPTTRSIHPVTLLNEGRLLVVVNSGAVYAFDVETLEPRWKAGRTQ